MIECRRREKELREQRESQLEETLQVLKTGRGSVDDIQDRLQHEGNEGSGKRQRLNDDNDTVFDFNMDVTNDRIVYRYHDRLGNNHWVVRFPKTTGRSGKRYTMARKCSKCGKHTCCYCLQCNIPLCYCIGHEGLGSNNDRQCFTQHIREHVRRSMRIEDENTVSELINDDE